MMIAREELPTRVDQDRRDLAELEASRRTMVERIQAQIEWLVENADLTREEAAERARTPLPDDRSEQPPEHVPWWELELTLEAGPARGQALWQRIKDEARHELAVGLREWESLERRANSTPLERAQFLVVVEALTEALQPRDGLERLLVQQMAGAYDQHLAWQKMAAYRAQEDVWQSARDKRRMLEGMSARDRARCEEQEGWLPPRQTQAEAIEQAVLVADRYQRAFLRLLRAFRDNRRVFDSLVVAGGQVNFADQQINIANQ